MGLSQAERPSPGSLAAAIVGCTCPVMDNGNGQGCGRFDVDGSPLFWIAEDCPVHAGPK